MHTIDYLKLQAKNLFRDYKTKKLFFDSDVNHFLYAYSPKYFDIEGLFLYYDIDEDNFTLMNAQHIIAQLCFFEKWAMLLKASDDELELAKLLFDHQDKVDMYSWPDYIAQAEEMNQTTFDAEIRINIFKEFILTGKVVLDASPGYILKKQ